MMVINISVQYNDRDRYITIDKYRTGVLLL